MNLEFEIEKWKETDLFIFYKIKRKGLTCGKIMIDKIYKNKKLNKMILK